MIRYFDASALAKRYVMESHSADVAGLLGEGIATTGRLTQIEIASALARRHREGSLSLSRRDRLLKTMQRDMDSIYVVEISPEVAGMACRLLMKHKLRAADAVHLASALVLAGRAKLEVQFVGFDEKLNLAAEKEGLSLPALGRRKEKEQ